MANVTTSFIWFALTFWVYLETRSVFSAGVIGGAYMALVALCSLGFGVIVDHTLKKHVMVAAQLVTVSCYAAAGVMWLLIPHDLLLRLTHWGFWAFVCAVLLGSVVENMRNIALSTTVTMLVDTPQRDRANGLVGTVQGIAFMVTSLFSGLSIGLLGMGPTVLIALVASTASLLHLLTIMIPGDRVASHVSDSGDGVEPGERTGALARARSSIDLMGTVRAIAGIPGLAALILFARFNNLVGGVYMALMDPYGLELMSPQAWGVVLGVTSLGFVVGVTSIGFVVGGAIVAKFGLGRNPVRTLLLLNLGFAVLGVGFVIRENWVLYAAGIFVFMMIVPGAEAAEQTILQKVVPFERQGRVFGFAQSVETASAPVSAFLVAPLAEFVVIPLVQGPQSGQPLEWLLGDGSTRGMAALMIAAAGLMFLAVLLAFLSPQYRKLSAVYGGTTESVPAAVGEQGAQASSTATAGDASDNSS